MSEMVPLRPLDEHNRRLAANVHPPDWDNPVPDGRYNLVVIGGGTAGLVTAAGAAGLGAKVALIERDLLGGDCLNVGCVPSKTLIRSARVAALVRQADGYGVRVPDGVDVDFSAVMERMRKIRAGISGHDSAARFQKMGVDVFLENASFVDGNRIQAGGAELSFSRAVIAAGARAAAPPIPGLEEAGYLTNETVFSLTELPRRLAVIGAGPIGCELSQSFRRFGSRVSLIEIGPQILGREDRDAARIVESALVEDGVDLILDASIQGIHRSDAGLRIDLLSGGRETDIEVDQILVGVGRRPNTDGLNLESAGVDYDRGGVIVNDYLQTTNRRIYAAGDICFPYKFTHTADAMARIVIQNALFLGRKKTSDLIIPWTTYTDPEIAHVGLYPHQADEKGIEIDTFERRFAEVDRAVTDGETEGFVKIHTRKGTDSIVGATIVASHAGDMISEVTTAMVARLGLGSLAGVIHPYPTQAEAIRQTGDLYNRTRLTPLVQKLFERWLSWTR